MNLQDHALKCFEQGKADLELDRLMASQCADIRFEPSVSEGFIDLINQADREKRFAHGMEAFESAGVEVGPTVTVFGRAGLTSKELRTKAAYYWAAARWLEREERKQ